MKDLFYSQGSELGLRRGNMAVEWTNLGEGVCGDYNPDDPEDENLLRFDVYVLSSDPLAHLVAGEDDVKLAVDDASYCTNVRADTSEAQLRDFLVHIMNTIYTSSASIENPPHIKKRCEDLSWLGSEEPV